MSVKILCALQFRPIIVEEVVTEGATGFYFQTISGPGWSKDEPLMPRLTTMTG